VPADNQAPPVTMAAETNVRRSMGGTINRLSAMRLLFLATLWVTTLVPAAPAPLRVSAPSTPLQPGVVVLLTIESDDPAPDLRVRAFGHELAPFSVDVRRWQVLVGIDLDVKPGTYPVEIDTAFPGGRTEYVLVVTPRRFTTRTLKVDPDLVNPPPREMDRIARETAQLHRLWNAPAGGKLWDGPFVRPVPDAANSSFGTRSIYNGEPRSPHGGTDFLSPAGRPIKAPNAGRVVLAGPLYFTGGTVVIDHGLGVLSLFAHLSSIAVREGDVVKTGDVIGEVGATGRVTGPHLHWAMRVGGARVDPLSLLAAFAQQP
jgi:murein DD-endopeptidase MepM/ murein hydrolase activator NlpD